MFIVRDNNHTRECSLITRTCNWEVPGSNLAQTTDHPDKFRGTAQSIQPNSGVVSPFGHDSLLSDPLQTLLPSTQYKLRH